MVRGQIQSFAAKTSATTAAEPAKTAAPAK
jgi:hypothetical protein